MGNACVAALENNVSREIVRLGAEAVSGPCAGAWVAEEGKTCVHKEVALGVLAELGRHGPDNAEFVGNVAHEGQHVANGEAALTVVFKGPVGGLYGAVVIELGSEYFAGHGFAGEFLKGGLGIEGIDV